MDGFPFELAVFNSDMLNDENHIYFDMDRVTHGFGFVKFPIKGSIKETIEKASGMLCAYGHLPSYVFIPFKHFHEITSKETPEMLESGMLFRSWLSMMCLTPYIMTPDYLKEHVTL